MDKDVHSRRGGCWDRNIDDGLQPAAVRQLEPEAELAARGRRRRDDCRKLSLQGSQSSLLPMCYQH